MKTLLASLVLLLAASAARADDPTPWNRPTPGSAWLSTTLTGSDGKPVRCWVSAAAYQASSGNLDLYLLTLDKTVGMIKVYKSSPCPVSGASRMDMNNKPALSVGNAMPYLAPAAATMIVAAKDDDLARIYASLQLLSPQ